MTARSVMTAAIPTPSVTTIVDFTEHGFGRHDAAALVS
jgi:hypothetical protein